MSDDKKDAMPNWPDEFRDDFNWPLAVHYEQAFEHERALCAAWEARCRELHEAASTIVHLHDMYCESHVGVNQHSHDLESVASQALAAIGPLPDLPELPSSERG